MSNYEYKGCVTGFSESDQVTVWQPTENPYPVQHDDNEYANRLVDVALLQAPIGCIPTSLSFIPKVVIPADKDTVILRVVIEVNGEKILNHNGNDGFADISWSRNEIGAVNTAESIAKYLLLYSGVDLMRQLRAGAWFNYSPNDLDTFDEMPTGTTVTISGKQYDTPDVGAVDCTMTFKVIDNLPANAIDFTKEQWGHDVTVHSCAYNYFIGE